MAERKLLLKWGDIFAAVYIRNDFTLENLKELSIQTFNIDEEIQLFVYDQDFDEYVLLLNVHTLKDKQKIEIRRVFKNPSMPLSDSKDTGSICSSWSQCFKIPDLGSVTYKLEKGLPIEKADKSSILSTLFETIHKITLYPSSTDYRNVASALLRKYPKLDQKLGKDVAEDCWKSTLAIHFSHCRLRKLSNVPVVVARSLKRKLSAQEKRPKISRCKRTSLSGLLVNIPEDLAGKSGKTIQGHIDLLKEEYVKIKPDMAKVEESMTTTLADRRKKIVSVPKPVNIICETYPWLKDEKQIICEYSRLVGKETNIMETISEELKNMCTPLIVATSKVIKQGSMTFEVMELFNMQKTVEQRDNLGAPLSWMLLISACGENLDHFIVKKNQDEESSLEPIVIQYEGGDMPITATSFDIMIENTIIHCSSLISAICTYVSCHFVFNLLFSKKTKHTLTYIERFILKLENVSKTPLKVINIRKAVLDYESLVQK